MKVTIEQIESKIKDESYLVLPDGRTTLCILNLQNGYSIKGLATCIDDLEFDLKLGRKYAREDAVRQVWPLEGYLLAETLFNKFVDEPITLNEVSKLANKEFDKAFAKIKKPHWTQTLEGKKKMAMRRKRSRKNG